MKKLTRMDLSILADALKQCETITTEAARADDFENKFSISTWEFKCGYPSCVGGWAAHMFPESLKLDYPYEDSDPELRSKDDKYSSFDAFAYAFGISLEEAMYICSPRYYVGINPSVEQAVKRLRLAASDQLREKKKRKDGY